MCNLTKILFAFASIAALHSCVSPNQTYLVDFDQDVTVYIGSEDKKEIKQGDKVELPTKPVFIANSSFDVVALVPIPEKAGSIHVNIPKDSRRNSVNGDKNKDLGLELNQMAQAIVEIQQLIAGKHPDDALTRIMVLRSRYPNFHYLRFLEASCFFLKEDLPRAKDLVEEALRDFPNDTAGRAFAKQMGVKLVDPQIGATQ